MPETYSFAMFSFQKSDHALLFLSVRFDRLHPWLAACRKRSGKPVAVDRTHFVGLVDLPALLLLGQFRLPPSAALPMFLHRGKSKTTGSSHVCEIQLRH